MPLAVRISSYGCTWEVWRALKKLELLSAAPQATLTLLSCSPNFSRASITRYTHAKHEPILNLRTRNVLALVVSSQDSFRSCQILFMTEVKPARISCPTNEAEGQNTSRTTLLENGRDSETSTARESSTDIDVDDVDLEISPFWPHKA